MAHLHDNAIDHILSFLPLKSLLFSAARVNSQWRRRVFQQLKAQKKGRVLNIKILPYNQATLKDVGGSCEESVARFTDFDAFAESDFASLPSKVVVATFNSNVLNLLKANEHLFAMELSSRSILKFKAAECPLNITDVTLVGKDFGVKILTNKEWQQVSAFLNRLSKLTRFTCRMKDATMLLRNGLVLESLKEFELTDFSHDMYNELMDKIIAKYGQTLETLRVQLPDSFAFENLANLVSLKKLMLTVHHVKGAVVTLNEESPKVAAVEELELTVRSGQYHKEFIYKLFQLFPNTNVLTLISVRNAQNDYYRSSTTRNMNPILGQELQFVPEVHALEEIAERSKLPLVEKLFVYISDLVFVPFEGQTKVRKHVVAAATAGSMRLKELTMKPVCPGFALTTKDLIELTKIPTLLKLDAPLALDPALNEQLPKFVEQLLPRSLQQVNLTIPSSYKLSEKDLKAATGVKNHHDAALNEFLKKCCLLADRIQHRIPLCICRQIKGKKFREEMEIKSKNNDVHNFVIRIASL